jgi:galactokinase
MRQRVSGDEAARAEPIEAQFTRVSEAFRARFGRAPEGIAWAPGRVNLIGEHLDYNGGPVLPAAIDRSVLVAYARRPDAALHVVSLDFAQETVFSLADQIERDEQGPWSNYVRGVVSVLLAEGRSGPGLAVIVTGDVPIGAGLSSSAALEVALLGAVRAAWGLEFNGERLALLAQRAEHEFVGVQCGVMDQLASALSEPGHALLLDCRSLRYEHVSLPLAEHGVVLAVIDSGVTRRLETSAYNRRREECAEALRVLQRVMPRPPNVLADVSGADLAEHGAALPPELLRRARHVVTETARVRHAVRALRSGDFEAFAALMNASHASLRDDFEVSCPELDRLVALAQAHAGTLGARLTGAGFGGCTVNLVRAEALAGLERDVVEPYARETGLRAGMYVCRPAGGLRLWPPV